MGSRRERAATHDEDMPPSLRLLGRDPRELPRLCDPVRARDRVSFSSGSVHVRVENVDVAYGRNVDRDAADGLAGEEVALDEVEREAVEGVRRDESRDDRVSREDGEAGPDGTAAQRQEGQSTAV